MKCELCGSSHQEPERKLCQPCIEAVARLWNIANQQGLAIACEGAPAGEPMQAGSAPKTARPPYALL